MLLYCSPGAHLKPLELSVTDSFPIRIAPSHIHMSSVRSGPNSGGSSAKHRMTAQAEHQSPTLDSRTPRNCCCWDAAAPPHMLA